MYKAAYIVGIVFILFATSTSAQDSTRNLPTVNVQRAFDSIVKIAIITAPVPHFELHQQQLTELGVVDLGEALKFLPGFQIQDYGGIGGIKTAAFRGTGAGHTAVVIDGNVMANTQTGVVNLSGFETFGLENVAFASGQNQTNNATATAYTQLNTVSTTSLLVKKPKRLQLGVYGNATTINAFEQGGYVVQPLGNQFFVGGQGMVRYGNGAYNYVHPLEPGVEQTRINTRLFSYRTRGVVGFDNGKNALILSGYFDDAEQELPGATVLFNPSADKELWLKNTRLNANYKHETNRWKLTSHLGYQNNRTRYQNRGISTVGSAVDAQYFLQQSTTGFVLERKLKRKSERIFIGGDYLATNLTGNNLNIRPTRLQNNNVLGISKWIGRFNVAANVTTQFIADQFPTTANLETNNRFKLSPFVAVALLPFKKHAFRIRAFYKNAFRMPSFNDLYYNAIGNFNLRPEDANAFNIGLTYGINRKKVNAAVTVDGYYNQVTDKIVAVATKDLFNWSIQNIGKSAIYGVDIAGHIAIKLKKSTIRFYTNHNINRSLDVTNPASPSYKNQLPYTPFYSGSNGFNWLWKGFNFSANILISGFRFSLNENNFANFLPGYSDLNLGVGKTIGLKKAALFIDLKAMNIFNKNYQVVRSFPMPGRYYQLRVIFKLNEQ